MEKKRFLRKLFFCSTCLGFMVLPFNNYGQTIKRQCISSYAASPVSGQLIISQTAGQSYNTGAGNQKSKSVFAGFQQADAFAIEVIESNQNFDLNVKVFPNPAVHSVTISNDKPMGDFNITIADSYGKIIDTHPLPEAANYELNCDKLSNGIYFIILSDKLLNKQTLKLVISK